MRKYEVLCCNVHSDEVSTGESEDDEELLRRIEHKVRRIKKQEEKKESPQEKESIKVSSFTKWITSKSLDAYLVEALLTESAYDNELLLIMDAIKTAVQVISCSLRKQGFGQMFLLGSNENAKWFGNIVTDRVSQPRFFINELLKTGAVCMVACRGCPRIKRIKGHEHAPYIIVINTPSNTTMDCAAYACSWIIYRLMFPWTYVFDVEPERRSDEDWYCCRRPTTASMVLLDRDAMLEGKRAITAGYAIIGISTTLVFTVKGKKEVMEFIYDVETGDFIEQGPMSLGKSGTELIFNESHLPYYDEGLQKWIEKERKNLRNGKRDYHPFNSGNVVLEANRIIRNGGLFLSPRDSDCKEGRLRLMFECTPLSFIIKKLGGIATDGESCILSRKPRLLRERSAFFFGTPEYVNKCLTGMNRNEFDYHKH